MQWKDYYYDVILLIRMDLEHFQDLQAVLAVHSGVGCPCGRAVGGADRVI